MGLIKYLLFISLLASCVKEPICGTCRVYEYEYNEDGHFRVIKTPTEQLFCGEYYKSATTRDTLTDGYIRQIQKECY